MTWWCTTRRTAPEAPAGTDYTPASGNITILHGETSKVVEVAVKGDTIDEADETLTVALSLPGGTPVATIQDGAATGTIVDDDFRRRFRLVTSPLPRKGRAASHGDVHRVALSGERPHCEGQLRHQGRHGQRGG